MRPKRFLTAFLVLALSPQVSAAESPARPISFERKRLIQEAGFAGSPRAWRWQRWLTQTSWASPTARATQLVFTVPANWPSIHRATVYAAEAVNSRVRRISPDGTVTTVVGGGSSDSHGDEFVQPTGVATGPNGELHVLDGGPKMARVRKIAPDGKVTTLVVVDGKTRTASPGQSLPPAGTRNGSPQ